MTPFTRRVASGAVLLFACLALSGAALAGNGNGSTPPGQEKKDESQPAPPAQAAPPAHQAQARQAEKQETKAAEKAAPKPSPGKSAQAPGQQKKSAADKPAKGSKSFKETSSGTDLEGKDQDHKHTICHATGSASNPYVLMTPSISGVANGHMGHQDAGDIVPPFSYKGASLSQNWDAVGQAIFANGCELPTASETPLQEQAQKFEAKQLTACPETGTETRLVLDYVLHKTGAFVDGQPKYVRIQPDDASAHLDKHEDDLVFWKTVTTVISTGEECRPALPLPAVVTGGADTAGAAAAATPSQPVAGGVAGAQATLATPKAAAKKSPGGVAGAVTRIGRVAGGNLPFTGLPLWFAVALAVGLLAAGAVALRAGRGRA